MAEQRVTKPHETEPKHVAVVGGGLAGISAALELAQNGVRVTLLEGKNRLGGRAGSFTTNSAGREETVDYCQHVGMGCCHNLKRLIKHLHQEEHWATHRTLHFYGADGRHRKMGALPLPAPLHIGHWLWMWPGLGMRDRLAVAMGMLKIRRVANSPELDGISATDWLKSAGQTQRAIEQFWSTIIVSALGEDTSRVSITSVCKVLQDGFLNASDAFHLLVPKRPLNFLFNESAQDGLKQSGVQIQLAHSVRSIRVKDRVELTAKSLNTHTESVFHADNVVLAVPWNTLGRIEIEQPDAQLSNALNASDRLVGSPITGIHTWWDRPWLSSPHAAIVGRLCQWVFPKPNDQDADTPEATDQRHYYQIVISASRALKGNASEDFGQIVHADLAEVFPLARQAKLLDYRVVTDPNAVFSVAPGALRFRASTTSNSSPIRVAGDWTDTGWPATMEGAIISGLSAARSITHPNTPHTLP